MVNIKEGNRIEGNFPCPECGKDRTCEKRNAYRICKSCNENRPKLFDRKKWTKELRTRMKQFAFDYLGGKCNMCGADDLPLCCYHFHHKDPDKKEYNIGRLFNIKHEKNKTKIKNELDKCSILCANCHAIKHWVEDE